MYIATRRFSARCATPISAKASAASANTRRSAAVRDRGHMLSPATIWPRIRTAFISRTWRTRSFDSRGRILRGMRVLRHALLPLFLLASAALAQETFALRDGDRVVFFGDSITDQRLYT